MLNLTLGPNRFFKLIIYNILFIGVLYFAYRNIQWNNVDLRELHFNYIYLVLSVIFFLIFYLCLAIGWQKVLGLYFPKKKEPVYLTYLASQIFKYLPSSIFIFSIQAIITRNLGFDLKRVTPALLIQFGLTAFTALIMYLLFSKWWIIGLFIISSYIVGTLLMNNKIIKLHKLPIVGHVLNFEKKDFDSLFKILLIFCISWIFSGLSIYYFSISLGHDTTLFNLISMQSLSYFASIVAVFAPGGLGVREYVLSLSTLSLNTIVLWRVFTTIADVTISIVALYKLHLLKNQVFKKTNVSEKK